MPTGSSRIVAFHCSPIKLMGWLRQVIYCLWYFPSALIIVSVPLFQLLVSSQPSFSTADDLYLEGQASGNLPIDDDDDDGEDEGSGSGSGNYGKEAAVFVF